MLKILGKSLTEIFRNFTKLLVTQLYCTLLLHNHICTYLYTYTHSSWKFCFSWNTLLVFQMFMFKSYLVCVLFSQVFMPLILLHVLLWSFGLGNIVLKINFACLSFWWMLLANSVSFSFISAGELFSILFVPINRNRYWVLKSGLDLFCILIYCGSSVAYWFPLGPFPKSTLEVFSGAYPWLFLFLLSWTFLLCSDPITQKANYASISFCFSVSFGFIICSTYNCFFQQGKSFIIWRYFSHIGVFRIWVGLGFIFFMAGFGPVIDLRRTLCCIFGLSSTSCSLLISIASIRFSILKICSPCMFWQGYLPLYSLKSVFRRKLYPPVVMYIVNFIQTLQVFCMYTFYVQYGTQVLMHNNFKYLIFQFFP